jgi:Subtilase family
MHKMVGWAAVAGALLAVLTVGRAAAAPVVSEGLVRTGATAIQQAAHGGQGLTIAVLDMGFGSNWPALQAIAELPPPSQVIAQSFDPNGGLAGSNTYDNSTEHGQLVAQTVYDYAPAARYLFVNYHTEAQFVAAVGWLIAQHPNIVVHSNSFLDGPFDGTNAPAQAVDRAAASGILWFNSAGNYGLKHWSGAWSDPDGDGILDWPNSGWTFPQSTGETIGFTLSWPGAPGSVLRLVLQHLGSDGAWSTVASSRPIPGGSATGAEIPGYVSPHGGTYRLQAQLVSGPPPAGTLTLFSREIPLAPMGGSAVGSVPTPADAAGALAIGAVDWHANAGASYSSQGPTADGRLKPDLVAPTNTSVADPAGGRHSAGGTSIACPNAAGAAALLWAAERAAGQNPTAADIRAELGRDALDLGPPGPDPAFGAGRARVYTTPPAIVPVGQPPRSWAHGLITVGATVIDPLPLAAWSLTLDGRSLGAGTSGAPAPLVLDSHTVGDGPHVVAASATDATGNQAQAVWRFVVDNTPPQIALRRVLDRRLPGSRAAAERRPRLGARATRRLRHLWVELALNDNSGHPMRAGVRLVFPRTEAPRRRAFVHRPTGGRWVDLGRLARGRYTLVLTALDPAGNRQSLSMTLPVR